MSATHILFFSGRLYWGLVSQVTPFSKTRLSYRVPPPTTIIGALAYPLALLTRSPEFVGSRSWADTLRSFVLWSSAKLTARVSRTVDITRAYWYHRGSKEAKTDAFASEKVYVSDDGKAGLELAVLLDSRAARSVLGDEWSEKLLAAAWSVTRMGQKEGLFSVENAGLIEVSLVKNNVVETGYYFPDYLGVPTSGSFMIELFVHPRTPIADYSSANRIRYIVPYDEMGSGSGLVKVKLNGRAAAVRLPNGDTIVLEKEVVS